MKKVLIVAAAAGLTALAACTPSNTNNTTVINDTDVVINDVQVDANTTMMADNVVAPVEANVVEMNSSNAM
ncbi:hypothetical protein DMC47_15135 [Nostoc sp. 3335mG]|jgi:hypothetical protein|nr:hypothetical protein DMC47_15135 [Nostoc sp. 3335mG]